MHKQTRTFDHSNDIFLWQSRSCSTVPLKMFGAFKNWSIQWWEIFINREGASAKQIISMMWRTNPEKTKEKKTATWIMILIFWRKKKLETAWWLLMLITSGPEKHTHFHKRTNNQSYWIHGSRLFFFSFFFWWTKCKGPFLCNIILFKKNQICMHSACIH